MDLNIVFKELKITDSNKNIIKLPRPIYQLVTVRLVDTINNRNTLLVKNKDYIVDNDQIKLNTLAYNHKVEIVCKTGYGPTTNLIPDQIKHGMLNHIKDMYHIREKLNYRKQYNYQLYYGDRGRVNI